MAMADSKYKNPQDLINAAQRGDFERAQSLIDDEYDINGRGYYSTGLHTERNSTALHAASGAGHADVAEVLIKNGADVNAKNYVDWTPLHHAANNGHEATTRLLLQSKAAIDAQDFDGDTPLHHAVYMGGENTAKLLLDYKASVDIQNKYGDTPLHKAAGEAEEKTTKLLLKYKASVDIQNNDGDTPLDILVKRYLEYVKIQNNQKQSKCLRFIILLLSLAPVDISIKKSLKKMKKLGKFVVDSPDVDILSVDICDEKASSTLTSWYKNSHTASVVVFSDNTTLSKLSDELMKERVLSSIILFDVDMKNVKKVPNSHAVCLFSIRSFDQEKVMSWPLQSIKIFQCVDNIIRVPWSIKLSCSLDILNISHCYPKVENRTLASHENEMKYIHIACDSVKQLSLNDSGLTALQEDVGSIPRLEVLNVSNNSIQRIPPSLCKLADIQTLNIEGNPSVNIPPDIIAKGIKAVCNYLKEFLDSNTVPKNNVKVILLGHEGVGKTTLVAAITGGDAKNVVKTDGITVSTIHLDHSDINLTFFDFAGDVDFLESHSLFITDDTVFLLVFDLSKFAIGNSINEVSSLHQIGRVRLWLQTIFVYAPNSSVILVGTHADAVMLNKVVLGLIWQKFHETLKDMAKEHRLCYKQNIRGDCLVCHAKGELDRQSKYCGLAGFVKIKDGDKTTVVDNSSETKTIFSSPHIVGYFEVCSTKKFPNRIFRRKNKSIKQLRTELKNVCERVIEVDPVIPERWHLLKESLKSERMKRKNPIMSYREYRILANDLGIMQETSLRNVTSFLCSQGEIVLDPSKLNDDSHDSIIVLDPQWLADKLRTLISFERDLPNEEYIDRRGILSNEKMEMWVEEDKDHSSLLKVFESMHVCVPFSDAGTTAPTDSSQCYLFPCKLPVGQPCIDDWFPSPKSDERQASLLFVFKFLPPLFFCDLIVAVHSNEMSEKDEQPKCTRNTIVFHCYKVVGPCDYCKKNGSEGNATDRTHNVLFELLHHSNSIIVSARGNNACCMVHHLGGLLKRIKMKPLYRHVEMEEAKWFACPYCIRKQKYNIGYMKRKGNRFLCSTGASEHYFTSMESLLLWKGVERIDIVKLINETLDDRHCPSYFVMLPLNIGSMSVLDQIAHWVQSHLYDGYAVHLLCEEPNQFHFIESPGYRIKNVRGFLRNYGQHVFRVLNIVQDVGSLFSFIPGPHATAAAATTNTAKETKALLSGLVNDFGRLYPELNKIRNEKCDESMKWIENSKKGLSRREFQRFLGTNDENGQFGGLYPVQRGDHIIWVCGEHGQLYKPPT